MKTKPCPWGLAVLLVALLFLLLGLRVVHAQDGAPAVPATAIASVPYKITKPGLYIVHKDLVLASSTGVAISVLCGDVTLDLGMHRVSSGAPLDNTNTSKGILLSGTGDFTIRNGSIRGFFEGIYSPSTAATVNSVRIENLTCSGVGHSGILLDFFTGTVEVDHCLMLNCGYSTAVGEFNGIYVNARSVRITNCRVINTSASLSPYRAGRGIFCTANVSGVVNRNYVEGGGVLANSDGIILASGRLTASENSVFNCNIGIQFSNNAVGHYQDNLSSGCTTPYSGGGTLADAGGNY